MSSVPVVAAPGLGASDSANDAFQVGRDASVHFDDPRLPCRLGLGDEPVRGAEMVKVLGEEVGGGDEYRAGKARVGVWAALLERQSAIPVGQGHRDPAQILFHPCRVVESVVFVGFDGLAPDIDFRCLFPEPANGFILEPCLAGRHLVGFVVKEPADHFLRDVSVDQACRVCVAELVGGEAERVALFIDDGTFFPGFQFLPGGHLHPTVVGLFRHAMELRIPHNYFTAWMVTPSRECAGSRPVDVLGSGPAPLLRALEPYSQR